MDADGVVVGEAEECASCRDLEDKLKGAERDVNTWRLRYAKLARDKEAEAEGDKLFPVVRKLYEVWKRDCKHPRAGWDADCFFVAKPFLKKDGYEMCLRAVAGAAYDPWKAKQRNGYMRRFDEWDRIFGSRSKFESFCNRAPRGWSPDPEDLPDAEA